MFGWQKSEYVESSGAVDIKREDFIFFAIDGSVFPVFQDSDCEQAILGAVPRASGASVVCAPRYVSNFELIVSDDASGTFTLAFVPWDRGGTVVITEDGKAIPGVILEPLIVRTACDTDADCDDGDGCTFDQCTAGKCSNTAAGYGDVAVASGVCGPDGVVDVFDILVLF